MLVIPDSFQALNHVTDTNILRLDCRDFLA